MEHKLLFNKEFRNEQGEVVGLFSGLSVESTVESTVDGQVVTTPYEVQLGLMNGQAILIVAADGKESMITAHAKVEDDGTITPVVGAQGHAFGVATEGLSLDASVFAGMFNKVEEKVIALAKVEDDNDGE
ncbi:hypothetical protein N9893_01570 [bacterium]|nr:hypothetical protein [bacterium]